MEVFQKFICFGIVSLRINPKSKYCCFKIIQIDWRRLRKSCGLNLCQVMESRMRGKVGTETERGNKSLSNLNENPLKPQLRTKLLWICSELSIRPPQVCGDGGVYSNVNNVNNLKMSRLVLFWLLFSKW